jgi:hypothetical protein
MVASPAYEHEGNPSRVTARRTARALEPHSAFCYLLGSGKGDVPSTRPSSANCALGSLQIGS